MYQKMFFLYKTPEQPKPPTKSDETKDFVEGMFQENVLDRRWAATICGDRQHSLLEELNNSQ